MFCRRDNSNCELFEMECLFILVVLVAGATWVGERSVLPPGFVSQEA